MSLGSEAVKDLGNLYSAALPAWIAAGFEEAAGNGTELIGAPMVAVGYGSGDAAEALPDRRPARLEGSGCRIGFAAALENPSISAASSTRRCTTAADVPGLDHTPAERVRITRVGESYDPSFQDLGVEYYEYVV